MESQTVMKSAVENASGHGERSVWGVRQKPVARRSPTDVLSRASEQGEVRPGRKQVRQRLEKECGGRCD